MTWLVRFLPEAKDEFDHAANWYEGKRAGLGEDFIDRVQEQLQHIAANPKIHAAGYRGVRKAVVARFPYVVLYREDDSGVLVISIFHTSRDPQIWQVRADIT
jgi:plasmid stabilization system protein ParE